MLYYPYDAVWNGELGTAMRLSNAVHESRSWRIREIAPDFTLEDVWALPAYGGAGDFPALLEVMTSRDLARNASPVTRLLFGVRLLLGRWFGWDDGAERSIPGRPEASRRSAVQRAMLLFCSSSERSAGITSML